MPGRAFSDDRLEENRPLSGNWVAKLQRFVAMETERCELCGVAIPSEHSHMLDVTTRQAVCVCRSCTTLMGGRRDGRFRAIPAHLQSRLDVRITDAEWTALQIPIGMAFLLRVSPDGRPMALYPGPAGVTEAWLHPEAWAMVVANNPLLAGLEPDVEALLVNRIGGRHACVRLPIDRCFVLVALIRRHWRGISGGDNVWAVIDEFLAQPGAPAHG